MKRQDLQQQIIALSRERIALNDAIEALYVTFRSYALPPIVEGCPCCVTKEDNTRIHSRPLLQLTGDDLGRFAFKALTTWGDEDDFRHFLPRCMELIVLEGSVGWTDPEIVFGKLDYAHWREWPLTEQNAIEQYLDCWWQWVLASDSTPGSLSATTILGSIHRAGIDLTPYLTMWLESPLLTALEQLGDLLSDVEMGGGSDFPNAFCDQNCHTQFNNWLFSLSTLTHIEERFFETYANDDKMASALSFVAEKLRLLSAC